MSSIRIDSMQIRGEICEKVMLEMCFEGVRARYDKKMSMESIPAAWGRVREGFFYPQQQWRGKIEKSLVAYLEGMPS